MKESTRNGLGLFILILILAGGFIALLLLPGCNSTRPRPADREAEATAPIGTNLPAIQYQPPLDSAAIKNRTAKETGKKPAQEARNGIFSFLTGRKATKEKGNVKLKNVTIQQVIGDNNKVAAGDTKLKDSQQASDSATLTSSGTGNAATQQGDGNQLEQKATVEQAPDWKAALTKALAGPVGIVLGIAAAGGLIYLIIAWRRKRAASELIS